MRQMSIPSERFLPNFVGLVLQATRSTSNDLELLQADAEGDEDLLCGTGLFERP
jgi:hypothetical protein